MSWHCCWISSCESIVSNLTHALQTLFNVFVCVTSTVLHVDISWLIKAEWRIYTSVNYAIIYSDNGLSSDRCQTIVWPDDGIFFIKLLGTNLSEIWIKIQESPRMKITLESEFAKCRPFSLSVHVLARLAMEPNIKFWRTRSMCMMNEWVWSGRKIFNYPRHLNLSIAPLMVGSQKSTFKYLHIQSKHSQSNIIDKFDLFHNRSCISAKINADEMDINFQMIMTQ